MTHDELASCINTVELFRRRELNMRGMIDVVDSMNCDKIIEMLINYPRWIPCSERLPEPRIDVWCNSDMGQMVGFYDETTENWYKSDYSLELIVDAWMPLPSPYREEADE